MEDVLDVYHRPPDPGCPVVRIPLILISHSGRS
jgi:hypothetical protein